MTKSGIILLLSLVCLSFVGDPPCGSDAFLEKCAPSLGDNLYLTTFDVETSEEGEKVEFRYIMSKGSSYRIAICTKDAPGGEMKVQLLDRDKKKLLSNHVSGKYYELFDFSCSATGVYYLQTSFKPGKTGCGSIILGLGD